MNGITPRDIPAPVRIDLKKEIVKSEWKEDPVIGSETIASLAIVRWVLMIFGGVYSLSFTAMFFLFYRTDATFEKGSELVKFMLQSILPWSRSPSATTWAIATGLIPPPKGASKCAFEPLNFMEYRE